MSSPGRSSPRGITSPNRVTNPSWLDRDEQDDGRDRDGDEFTSVEEKDKINLLSLKEQGCTIDDEIHEELCKIKNALFEDKAEFRIAMVEDGLKEFEKIWAKITFHNKRILIKNNNSCWDTIEDEMNEFVVTNKARSVNKVKVKAPIVKISPWDGTPASFFAWFGQTIKMLERLDWDPIVEKSVLVESLPELIRGRCDQFTSAEEIKAFIWRSYGTSAFLTKGMEEILKKTCRFEGMEEFISKTIPNILKIESALESYSALGRFGRDEVNMRVWHTAMLGMVFNVLNTQTMRMVKEDLRHHEEVLHRVGGWEHSSKCFDIIVFRLKKIEANREIELLGEEQAEGSSETRMYTKAVYVQGTGQETVRQCGFCAQTPGKDSNHWPFGKLCDSTFMKQEDVITAIEALKLCPSCLLIHGTTGQCRDKLPNGKSTTCFKGCTLGGKRLAYFACPHGKTEIKVKSAGCKIEQTVTSVPLVEQWRWDEEVFQVQYDAGASSSLIWAETIKRVPQRDVRLGKRKRVAVAAYGAHLTEMVDIQEAELTYRGMKFPVMIIPNRLEEIYISCEGQGAQRVAISDVGGHPVTERRRRHAVGAVPWGAVP